VKRLLLLLALAGGCTPTIVLGTLGVDAGQDGGGGDGGGGGGGSGGGGGGGSSCTVCDLGLDLAQDDGSTGGGRDLAFTFDL
jgi:hypothetical protein